MQLSNMTVEIVDLQLFAKFAYGREGRPCLKGLEEAFNAV